MGGGGLFWIRRSKNAKHHCRFCLFHVCNGCSTSMWKDGNGDSKLLKIHGERACKRCYAVAKLDGPKGWAEYIKEAKYHPMTSNKRRRLVRSPRSPALKRFSAASKR